VPNVVAPTLESIQLSSTEIFLAGETFVQPDWYADKYVLMLHLSGKIGNFDYDLFDPDVREDAINEERRQFIEASQRCPGCY
jgi:hypothetical protein